MDFRRAGVIQSPRSGGRDREKETERQREKREERNRGERGEIRKHPRSLAVSTFVVLSENQGRGPGSGDRGRRVVCHYLPCGCATTAYY
jgi:hypothetical protein